MNDQTDLVLIWSGEHRAWWRPNCHGYTTEQLAAGVYRREEAELLTAHCGPEKMIKIDPLPPVPTDDGTFLSHLLAEAHDDALTEIEAEAQLAAERDEENYISAIHKHFPAAIERARAEVKAQLKGRIDARLNDALCGMEPGYDDSIVGLNEAWDIVCGVFEVPK